jgi:glycosyltransferase involved in cell wall biosynthesis
MIDNPPQDIPLITIGVTCYNAEETIGRAIESALKQDWPQLEIIVVDDRSSDHSWESVEEFAEKDHRIKCIRHEENRGYAAALNTIIESSNGEYIAFFDDDDVSAPDRLEKQWGRLSAYEAEHHTNNVLCYSNRNLVTPDGQHRANHVRALGRSAPEPRGAPVADFLLWHHRDRRYVWGQFGSCTLMARKKTIAEIGGFDEEFRRGAEWDLAIRLSIAGGHFIAVDEPLITQFITQTADKAGDLPLKYLLGLRRKHRAYLESRHLYRASVAMAHARFHYARQQKSKSRFYLALACLYSPFRVLPSEFANWKRK